MLWRAIVFYAILISVNIAVWVGGIAVLAYAVKWVIK